MIASALPLVLILASILVLGVTGNLFSSLPWVVALQVAAVALNLWARISFQKGAFRVSAAPSGTAVIHNGPYRFIRHPMYLAVLLFIWVSVASHLSGLTLAIGIATTALAVTRVIVEERLLRAQCPGYQEYARTTKALIPFVL